MKKLMLALAAVVVAGVANAAALNWQYYADSSTYEGDTVYILKAYDSSKTYSLAELATEAVASDTIQKNVSGRNTYYRAGGANYTHTITGWNSEENGGQAVTFYQVLVHDGKYFAHEASGTTWGGTISAPANAPGIGSATAFANAVSSATWTTPAAVPEPTSGLLMLLGVAGLALRRRRA